jgi:hypothetical protein
MACRLEVDIDRAGVEHYPKVGSLPRSRFFIVLAASASAQRTFAQEVFMTTRRKPDTETALQYLIWALEEIEKIGQPEAAAYARMAMEDVRGVLQSDEHTTVYAEEAKRFRDKADEAGQLIGLAETASRREALLKIAENYRRTAEQMDGLSEGHKKGRKSK